MIMLEPRLALTFLLLAGAASLAAADHLVLIDGSVMETKGPWKLEGNRVTFTNSTGVKSVVRASNVDLEASRTYEQRMAEEYARRAAAAEAASSAIERRPVNVVEVAARQPEAPHRQQGVIANEVVMNERGSTVALGQLSKDLGIRVFPSDEPGEAARLEGLTRQYLNRTLAIVSRFDYEKGLGAVRDAEPELREVAGAARQRAAREPEYIRDGLEQLADALDRLATMAVRNKRGFAKLIGPHVG